MESVLKVFAKAPEPGVAKTRLIPALGAAGAAALQRRLTAATVRAGCAAGYDTVELWCSPDLRHPFFVELAAEYPVVLRLQEGADLGERMHRAFGRDAVQVLVGTDCPGLDAVRLAGARELLAQAAVDVVLGPAEDGGYVLVGLKQPQRSLFSAMPWGTSEVLARTRQRLAGLGLAARELSPLPDIDRPQDLALLDGEPP